MKLLGRILSFMAFFASVFSHLVAGPTIAVSAGIDTKPWDALLRKYVNEQGLVAYEKWRNDTADMKALDGFLERYSAPAEKPAQGPEEIAALINAYNAFTIRWILQHYPTESIRALKDSFGGARWKIGGRTVSLDEIEHKNLRTLYDWKTHATIVCAARSCPPILREAFTAANLDALTEKAFRVWLGREDLNRFDLAAKRAEVSPIFKWFKGDFKGEGELTKVLARYAPEKAHSVLERGDFKIEYLDYNWGLNDQGGRGGNFRAGVFDRLFGNAK